MPQLPPGNALYVAWTRYIPWYLCGMGKRTSVYLSDDLDAAVKASGESLAELVRRGLSAWTPEEAAARLAAAAAAEAVREDQRQDLREIVREEIRSALERFQGGGYA